MEHSPEKKKQKTMIVNNNETIESNLNSGKDNFFENFMNFTKAIKEH